MAEGLTGGRSDGNHVKIELPMVLDEDTAALQVCEQGDEVYGVALFGSGREGECDLQ
jgi:hypothetical protein